MATVTIPRDGTEVQVHIHSSSESELAPWTFLDIGELTGGPTSLRLIDCVFALEGDMTVYLWWDDAAGDTLILPLEGRGRLDLSPIGGIQNPRNEGWTGHVQLTTAHKSPGTLKSFFLGLEFAKVRA